MSADPPFVVDVDSGRVTPITGVDTRGQPVLTVQAVGRDAVVLADSRSGPSRPSVYVVRHGTTRATRIGTGFELAPGGRGHGLWLIRAQNAHRCVLEEISLGGGALRRPRWVSCSSRLIATCRACRAAVKLKATSMGWASGHRV